MATDTRRVAIDVQTCARLFLPVGLSRFMTAKLISPLFTMPRACEFDLATQPKQSICEKQQLLQDEFEEEELPRYSVVRERNCTQPCNSLSTKMTHCQHESPQMVAWCFRIIFVTLLVTLSFLGGCVFERRNASSDPGSLDTSKKNARACAPGGFQDME